MTTEMNADIVIIGASLGGVLAAHTACTAGKRVVLTAEFPWMGGQMTAQGVPPDEHHAIERGGATRTYREFRQAMRAHYLSQRGFIDRTEMTEGCNPGDGWVSRLCIEPAVAAAYFESLLAGHVREQRLTILRGARLACEASVERSERRIRSVRVESPTGESVRLTGGTFLDATDTGDLIAAAGLPFRIGKEAAREYTERDAPPTANEDDQQPVTYVMALRRHDHAFAPIARPAAYDDWVNHIVPHYGHKQFSLAMPGDALGKSTALPLFAKGTQLDWWRYRRIVSARNWLAPREEVSLINWAQNDYAKHPLIPTRAGCMSSDAVSAAAKELSRCWLYWLQTAAPRDGGRVGFPELQLAADVLGTADGFAQQVYVRESRRIVAKTTLSQSDIAFTDGRLSAISRGDSVGVAWYNMDIHPTCVSGHGVNAKVRPFVLPIGAFVPLHCDNLIPACKNIGVTHLVNAATRVHPTEWLIGEVAGALAARASDAGMTVADYADNHSHEFQNALAQLGVPLLWDSDIVDSVAPSAL